MAEANVVMPPELDRILSRNIRALLDARRSFEGKRTREHRMADAITRFTGSMAFVYLHAALIGAWIVVNLRLVPGIRAFDPFPFVMLAMAASVEAIFLSTFVLISQNRMAAVNERRDELDVQINLLAEHELTKLIAAVDAVALKVGVDRNVRDELAPLEHDVTPETVLTGIENVTAGKPRAGTTDASVGDASVGDASVGDASVGDEDRQTDPDGAMSERPFGAPQTMR